MSALVLRGDAASLPLPDESVDLIVTSPPYFGLRSYTDGGEHYAGQIGSEATPREFLEALQSCTREWVRVLKPEGSLFVNLGDKYAGSRMDGSSGWDTATLQGGRGRLPELAATQGVLRTRTSVPQKSLMGMPWRYALGCIDDLGLILRAEIVWSKPNGLPESVTDRVRRSHEQVFHFTRSPRYFSAVDEVREPVAAYSGLTWAERKAQGQPMRAGDTGGGASKAYPGAKAANPLGKLPGSVWEIPSQPLTVPAHLGVDHFAAFPMELPRRIILGWSPSGVCTGCGQGRRPVAVADREHVSYQLAERRALERVAATGGTISGGTRRSTLGHQTTRAITGYACACPDATAPARPSVVLDPFSGTGTTALVASVLGRIGIGVDRSADYCRLARWRTTDPGERARALKVEKPPKQVDGQGELFEVTA